MRIFMSSKSICRLRTAAAKDAPINLLRSGGESQFARHPALFAENGLMQRALRAFPPGFPC
ncbi:hypothetical protein AL046_15765 [Pseudomonas syringae pv. avii]|nr:hypothetical protein AL046_15765 [Pseudomonas syringae pv. avii]